MRLASIAYFSYACRDSSVVSPGQRQPGYDGPVKIGLHPGAMAQIKKLLDVQGLSVAFATDQGPATVVRALDLHVAEGETLAIVGESGSGKSVTALSITRLIDHTGGHISGGPHPVHRSHRRVSATSPRETAEAMRRLRGPEMAMVFQEPMSSLNPVLRIGDQIAEAVMLHQGLGNAAALAEARRLLEHVRIPEAARQLQRYPFQLVRRHAPAGDDRDGAVLPAAPADRR